MARSYVRSRLEVELSASAELTRAAKSRRVRTHAHLLAVAVALALVAFRAVLVSVGNDPSAAGDAFVFSLAIGAAVLSVLNVVRLYGEQPSGLQKVSQTLHVSEEQLRALRLAERKRAHTRCAQ
mmetsp:Transcript_15015/g.40271  ORF Transcript_15015/g.40271 Transcript_15015/m.40271 type:complete len:124 (-) Transcript_15015:164-535(-)